MFFCVCDALKTRLASSCLVTDNDSYTSFEDWIQISPHDDCPHDSATWVQVFFRTAMLLSDVPVENVMKRQEDRFFFVSIESAA